MRADPYKLHFGRDKLRKRGAELMKGIESMKNGKTLTVDEVDAESFH